METIQIIVSSAPQTVQIITPVFPTIPSQTGNGGKFLTTDGSSASWSDRFFADDTMTIMKFANGDYAIYSKDANGFIYTGNIFNTASAFNLWNDQDYEISVSPYKGTIGVPSGGFTNNRVFELPDESGTLAVKRYKSYVALLSQSGTNAPVATVLENDLGGTVVWTREDEGAYVGTLSNAFTSGKTLTMINNFPYGVGNGSVVSISWNTSGEIYLSSGAIGTPMDDILINTPIEIRVYY